MKRKATVCSSALVPAVGVEAAGPNEEKQRAVPAVVEVWEAELRRTTPLFIAALSQENASAIDYLSDYRSRLRGRIIEHQRETSTGGNAPVSNGGPA
jgi:hypothetical protein